MSLSEITVQLKNKISYAHPTQGACEACFISLKAPNFSHLKQVAALRKGIVVASRLSTADVEKQTSPQSLPPEEIPGEIPTLTGTDILTLMEAYHPDWENYINCFMDLLNKGELFLLDGEIPLTDLLRSKLSIEDFYSIMGEYLANFIFASLQKS